MHQFDCSVVTVLCLVERQGALRELHDLPADVLLTKISGAEDEAKTDDATQTKKNHSGALNSSIGGINAFDIKLKII